MLEIESVPLSEDEDEFTCTGMMVLLLPSCGVNNELAEVVACLKHQQHHQRHVNTTQMSKIFSETKNARHKTFTYFEDAHNGLLHRGAILPEIESAPLSHHIT